MCFQGFNPKRVSSEVSSEQLPGQHHDASSVRVLHVGEKQVKAEVLSGRLADLGDDVDALLATVTVAVQAASGEEDQQDWAEVLLPAVTVYYTVLHCGSYGQHGATLCLVCRE
jgi:hypothetical protein